MYCGVLGSIILDGVCHMRTNRLVWGDVTAWDREKPQY